jgi:hypothetical protein
MAIFCFQFLLVSLFLFHGIFAPGGHKFNKRNGHDFLLFDDEERLAEIMLNGEID